MFKAISLVATAAAIAGTITLFLAPTGGVDAGPLAKPAETALNACVQRPWPYLNCVGTPFGNPHIRLITVDGHLP